MTIALPLTDFSSGRTDPRGDTTRRESRFRRRRQSWRTGYKSDYRNIANVIFPSNGCEPSHIGDSVYWLLLGSSWMEDGAVYERSIYILFRTVEFLSKNHYYGSACVETESAENQSRNRFNAKTFVRENRNKQQQSKFVIQLAYIAFTFVIYRRYIKIIFELHKLKLHFLFTYFSIYCHFLNKILRFMNQISLFNQSKPLQNVLHFFVCLFVRESNWERA